MPVFRIRAIPNLRIRAIFGNFQHIFSLKNPEFRTFFRFSTIFGKKGSDFRKCPLLFGEENNISIVMSTVIDYDMRDYVLTERLYPVGHITAKVRGLSLKSLVVWVDCKGCNNCSSITSIGGTLFY